MTGVEYEVDNSSPMASKTPAYFLIRKQERHSETSVTVLALYYVVGTGPQWGTVYQMPTIYSVLACNFVRNERAFPCMLGMDLCVFVGQHIVLCQRGAAPAVIAPAVHAADAVLVRLGIDRQADDPGPPHIDEIRQRRRCRPAKEGTYLPRLPL